MPRFLSARDYEFIQHINRDLVDDTMDTEVVLYKIVLDAVKVNIYGEAETKPRYIPVSLNAVIQYNKNISVSGEGFGTEQVQDVEFRFMRRMLQEVDVYPEIGDIIGYNNHYFEINNITETQLMASRPEYNMAIICSAHLTRRTSIDIEDTQV